jgi:SAM-dependent methyltransferase
MIKLNIGCGTTILKDHINVDVFDFPGIDKKHDLNKYPYPFKDNYADEILASHVIEHLNEPDVCVKELYRMLKPGGKLIIKVPYFGHSLAYSSWQHRHYFTISSFANLTKKSKLDWWVPTFRRVKVKVNFGGIYKFWPFTWLSMLIIKIYYPLYEDTFLRTLAPACEVVTILQK